MFANESVPLEQEGEAGGITQQIGATFFPMENIRTLSDKVPGQLPSLACWLNRIAASIHERFSVGPSDRSIFTSCRFIMTNMIQVCSIFLLNPSIHHNESQASCHSTLLLLLYHSQAWSWVIHTSVSLNTSPPRNRFTFLRRSCFRIPRLLTKSPLPWYEYVQILHLCPQKVKLPRENRLSGHFCIDVGHVLRGFWVSQKNT